MKNANCRSVCCHACNCNGLHVSLEDCRFVGRSVDMFCFGDSLAGMLVLARKVLKNKSDIQGDEAG